MVFQNHTTSVVRVRGMTGISGATAGAKRKDMNGCGFGLRAVSQQPLA